MFVHRTTPNRRSDRSGRRLQAGAVYDRKEIRPGPCQKDNRATLQWIDAFQQQRSPPLMWINARLWQSRNIRALVGDLDWGPSERAARLPRGYRAASVIRPAEKNVFPSRSAGLFDLELAPTRRANLAIDQCRHSTPGIASNCCILYRPSGESW